MKKSLIIAVGLIKQLDQLQRPARGDALLALLEFALRFGNPHVHGGIGIRKLAPHTFECRAGLQLRLLVFETPDAFRAEFIGTHDELHNFLKSRR